MKRTVFIAMLLLLLLACAGAACAGGTVVEGDWRYEILNPRSDSPTVRIIRYNPVADPPDTLIVPEQLGGYPVTEIKSYAFTGYRELEDYKTEKLPGMKTIILPSCLEKIDPGGFSIDEFREFRIENNPRYETRDGVLFDKETSTLLMYPKGREALSYTVPEGTLTISADAFAWTKWLQDLHLADSVRKIEKDAVSVTGLHLYIPEGIETIEPGGVKYASAFTSLSPRYQVINDLLVDTEEKKLVSVPNTQVSIRTIIVPEGVEIIGEWAFGVNTCFRVVFPSTLRIIEGWNSIYHIGCGTLELPEGLETIGDYFTAGDVKTIVFPSSLRTIGNGSFTYCENLESVVLPEGLESIGRGSFENNENLESVILPRSLKKIGVVFYDSNTYKAFRECPKLTLLVFPDTAAETFCRKNGMPYRYVFAGLWQADAAEAGAALSLAGADSITFRLEENTLELAYSLEGASRTENYPVEWTGEQLRMEGGYMEYELTDPEHLVLKMNGVQLHLTKAEDPV